jgi:hypothetical protein
MKNQLDASKRSQSLGSHQTVCVGNQPNNRRHNPSR